MKILNRLWKIVMTWAETVAEYRSQQKNSFNRHI